MCAHVMGDEINHEIVILGEGWLSVGGCSPGEVRFIEGIFNGGVVVGVGSCGVWWGS